MGDQLCSLKAAYLFVENQPDVDKVIMSVSPGNEMHYLWSRFIEKYNVDLVYDTFNPGNWEQRWTAWDKWRTEREIEGRKFDHYRELHLRIHGAMRQTLLCGSERGLGRRNIYSYWYCGQEHSPEELPPSADWFDDTLVHHPPHKPIRDVYISPHAKTQGNITFTFDFWTQVVTKLLDAGVTVTVGYDGFFCDHLMSNPLYKKHWGNHRQWMEQVCQHKLVACGNTGTGWLAAACGVPMVTMEPPNSQMPDHRYRECGLKNIIEVVDTPDAGYVAKRIIEEVQRVLVLTTGCYDVLHAGHVRHLERSRALGSRLVVALNSDESIRQLKGAHRPINPECQRKAVLESLRCVDEVRLFDGDNAIPLIKELKPQVLTNGYGYQLNDVVGRNLVESWGGRAVITCHGDASNEPSTTKIVNKVLRSGDIIEICRVAGSYSVNPFDKLKLMADEFLSVADLPGDVADLGAYKGGTSLILRRLRPDKMLHIFDTWNGTPFDDDLCHHKKGEWKADLGECRKLVGTDNKTNYYPGVFPQEIPYYLKEEYWFCFVYIDMDTYQSTKYAIDFFWPRLFPGGKLFFDDYLWEPCQGVQRAVDEAFYGYSKKRVINRLHTCIVERGRE